MVAPAVGALAQFAIPKLIDIGIPAWLAGKKGDVEEGMQARLKNLYAAQAGGRSGESATAQSQRLLQQTQALKQAMGQVTGAAARGSAAGAVGGAQAAAQLAAGGQAQQMLNMSQSAARDEALKKGALARQVAANMEGKLLGAERQRMAAAAESVERGFRPEQGGVPGAEGAAAGQRARKRVGEELYDVGLELKKQLQAARG